MSVKNKRIPLRHILSVDVFFHDTRLDAILLNEVEGEDSSYHIKVNPDKPFNKRPVIDELTMGIVRTIFSTVEQRQKVRIPRLFVAGHYENGVPEYFTDTYGVIASPKINGVLRFISNDILKDYKTPSVHTYLQRLERRSGLETEVLKRILNAWVIANLITDGSRARLKPQEEANQVTAVKETPSVESAMASLQGTLKVK